MWHRVTADETALLERAFNVMAAHSWQGHDVVELAKWLTGRFLFFEDGPDYEWVLGFEPTEIEREWHIVAEGFQGNFSIEAAKQPVEQLVSFLISQKAKAAFITLPNWVTGDPIYEIYRAVFNEARNDPAVAAVTEDQLDDGSRWEFVLR